MISRMVVRRITRQPTRMAGAMLRIACGMALSVSMITINVGFGVKVLPTDYVAISLEVRDYMFDIDITGENKTTHNLQGTLNISYFF